MGLLALTVVTIISVGSQADRPASEALAIHGESPISASGDADSAKRQELSRNRNTIFSHIVEAEKYARSCRGLKLDLARVDEIVKNATYIVAPRMAPRAEANRSIARPGRPVPPGSFPSPAPVDPQPLRLDCKRGWSDYGSGGKVLPGLLKRSQP